MVLPLRCLLVISVCCALPSPGLSRRPHSPVHSFPLGDISSNPNAIQESTYRGGGVGLDDEADEPAAVAWGDEEERLTKVAAASVFIQDVMRCREVPGVSVTVVQRDRVIMRQGFGVTDVEQATPTRGHSKFCIGSCTKAFVSTLLGILLAENARRYVAVTP